MYSYHTHTEYCDGKSTIIEFCEKAISLNIKDIAFTSHAPLPMENHFSIRFEKLFQYKDAVLEVKNKFRKELNIYLGLEADYIPNQSVSFEQWRKLLNPDLLIGSIHLIVNPDNNKKWFIDGPSSNYHNGLKDVFNGNIKKAVGCYFNQLREMIQIEKPDIIGHLDKVVMNNEEKYFSIDDSWFRKEVIDTLYMIKEIGSIVEINSRGLYKKRYYDTFPGKWILKECENMKIPMILAPDAHHKDDLLPGLELSLSYAKDAGVEKIYRFDGIKWIVIPIKSFSN